MAKNSNVITWIILIIGIIIIVNQFQSLDFKKVINVNVQNKLNNPPLVVDEICTLSINPNTIYVNEDVTGTINDGANTLCMVFINVDDIWYFLFEGTTNSQGVLTGTENIHLTGEFILAAICGECVTNQQTLTVLPLPADSDGDGFTDDEEVAAGTDPNNPNDYPGSDEAPNGEIPNGYTCGLNYDDGMCPGTCPSAYNCERVHFATDNYYSCVCVNPSTQELHPDWKPGGTHHGIGEQLEEPINGEESTFCFDNDFHLGFPNKLEVKSSCQDSFGTYWDYCDGNMIHDWFCDGNICSDALGQNCASFVPGSSCIDGACFVPPDYYDVTGADYWIHYDYVANGAPARMRGKFTTWQFDYGNGHTGSGDYVTLRVYAAGKYLDIPFSGHVDFNLDSFMNQFDGLPIQIKFRAKLADGTTRAESWYSGTVDMS